MHFLSLRIQYFFLTIVNWFWISSQWVDDHDCTAGQLFTLISHQIKVERLIEHIKYTIGTCSTQIFHFRKVGYNHENVANELSITNAFQKCYWQLVSCECKSNGIEASGGFEDQPCRNLSEQVAVCTEYGCGISQKTHNVHQNVKSCSVNSDKKKWRPRILICGQLTGAFSRTINYAEYSRFCGWDV